jgi:hypothetical protein
MGRQDGRTFVRVRVDGLPGLVRLDLTLEAGGDLARPEQLEGIAVESLVDLRVAKLTRRRPRRRGRPLLRRPVPGGRRLEWSERAA